MIQPPLPRQRIFPRALATLVLTGALIALTAAPASALPYYEVGQPTGRYEGKPSRGVVQIIHGGGWVDGGPGPVKRARSDAQRFRALGYTTLNHSYRATGPGILDVRTFYRRARSMAGPRKPVCVWGASAGAHWGLMLATQYPVDCAMAEALPTLKVPALPPLTDVLARLTSFFGRTQAARDKWSPVTYGWNLKGAVLVGIGQDDRLTPPRNGELMRASRPELVRFTLLPSGSCEFPHTKVSCSARTRFYRSEAALLRRAERRARRRSHAVPTVPDLPPGPPAGEPDPEEG